MDDLSDCNQLHGQMFLSPQSNSCLTLFAIWISLKSREGQDPSRGYELTESRQRVETKIFTYAAEQVGIQSGVTVNSGSY